MNDQAVITAGGVGGVKSRNKAQKKRAPSQARNEETVDLISLSNSSTNKDNKDDNNNNNSGGQTVNAENSEPHPDYDPDQIVKRSVGNEGENESVGSKSYSDVDEKAQGSTGSSYRTADGEGFPPPTPPVPTKTYGALGSGGSDTFWLVACFFGIMASFVVYGLLLEYTTSGGRQLHELSFLFITSLVYTLTAAAGRYVRDETPSSIPPARFAVLGLTSMGSTFCSVRSLRYVIYPIQVLAKSCKPVPVMLMGALMGKKYPAKKYFNVFLIVMGVGLFMGGGGKKKSAVVSEDDESSTAGQVMGITLLFISLCFDGGTGAYEDKLMSVHHVGPFDLMYNIQLGKTILAGVSLLILNQVHVFLQMVSDMGFLLVALGLSGAMGQVFIFVTIAKFGALTCSIIGLARKVTTLVASIYFYGHVLKPMQSFGLFVCVGAMTMNFMGKKGGGGGGHGAPPHAAPVLPEHTFTEAISKESSEGEEEADEEQPLMEGGVEMKETARI